MTDQQKCAKCGEPWAPMKTYRVDGLRHLLHEECATNLSRDHDVKEA